MALIADAWCVRCDIRLRAFCRPRFHTVGYIGGGVIKGRGGVEKEPSHSRILGTAESPQLFIQSRDMTESVMIDAALSRELMPEIDNPP